MAAVITHPFVSAVADGGDASLVQPSNWNADHTITGTLSSTQLDLAMTPTWTGAHTFSTTVSAPKFTVTSTTTASSVSITNSTATTAAYTLKLPTTDGGASEFLQTDGSGVLSWAAASATPGGVDTQVQFNDSSAFGGDAGLTFNKTTNVLTNTAGRVVIAGGTTTSSEAQIDVSATWNSTGATFTAIKLNVTNTASPTKSNLLDVQIGGTTKLAFIQEPQTGYAPQLNFGAATSSVPGLRASSSNLEAILGDGSAFATFHASTITLGATSSSVITETTLALAFDAGKIQFGAAYDAGMARVAAALTDINNGTLGGVGYLRLNGVAVASLPAASATYTGARGTVTNSNTSFTAGIGAVVAASTTTSTQSVVPVFCDGAAWRIG